MNSNDIYNGFALAIICPSSWGRCSVRTGLRSNGCMKLTNLGGDMYRSRLSRPKLLAFAICRWVR